MKLKRLLKITVFACLLFSVVSCQNDSPEEVMYSKTSMEQQTEQKLQCLYEMYKDKPIQSLFNTTRATREVLNVRYNIVEIILTRTSQRMKL